MSGSAQPLPDPPPEEGGGLARLAPVPASPILPISLESPARSFAFSPAPRPAEPAPKTPEDQVLRSLKDLQQLQKQTIAVLESVQGSLDDIHQVLRSPEATRGHEKQKNAATLLAKGFAREAVEQAAGAAVLLPANPEAHLLLALSLAADQQFDASLAATRKGLALVDRRVHPLAVEAGLLHALASLGCDTEAIDRWAIIIEALPLPVLLEQTGRIVACFPAAPSDITAADAPSNLLDTLLSARLQQPATGGQPQKTENPVPRDNLLNPAPAEIPPEALLAGLDAAQALPLTHRAILAQITQRLHAARNPADILKFLTECLIPLANRELPVPVQSLANSAGKRLLRFHADAQTLHRAMTKFQMASAAVTASEVARLLLHWRKAGKKVARARHALIAACTLFVIGFAVLGFVMLPGGKPPFATLCIGPAIIGLGTLAGLASLFTTTWNIILPANRPPLSREEIRFLLPASIRRSLRSAAAAYTPQQAPATHRKEAGPSATISP